MVSISQLLAQEHRPYHHFITFCTVGSPEKKVKGLVPHCHFPSPSHTSANGNGSLASSAFLLQAGWLQMLVQRSSGVCLPQKYHGLPSTSTKYSCSIPCLLLMPPILLSIWKNIYRGVAGGIPQFPQEKWGEYLNLRSKVVPSACWLWMSLGTWVWSCHYADTLWDPKVSSHSLRALSSSHSTMATGGQATQWQRVYPDC